MANVELNIFQSASAYWVNMLMKKTSELAKDAEADGIYPDEMDFVDIFYFFDTNDWKNLYVNLSDEIQKVVENGGVFECHSVVPTNCRNENRNHNFLNEILDKFVRESVSSEKFEYGIPEKFPNIILTPKDGCHMSLTVFKDKESGEVKGELSDYQHCFKFKPMVVPENHPFAIPFKNEKE
jgi:hypothetical protein